MRRIPHFRWFIVTLVVFLVAAVSAAVRAAPPDQAYALAWADEFNGARLDLAVWDYRTDSKHWSTQLPANVAVHDGFLWLTSIASHLGKTDAVDDSRLPVFAVFDYVRFYEKK